MYLHKINKHAPFHHKLIWKQKIPQRSSFGISPKRVILTKDNLVRKNWKGSLKCFFYNCRIDYTSTL